jgi:DHA1 family tetracycline resistance protein-like MFS transporter
MKKSQLLTVFLTVLMDLVGFGIVLPLLPFYAARFNASALAIGFLYSAYSLAQLVFSPLWGSLSDKIGRRPVMLVSTFGSALAYGLFSVSSTFSLLLFSRVAAGVMGGNISTAQAYVADVTSPQERSKGMGLIGAAFGIGFVIGPALSTFLIHPSFYDFLTHSGLAAFSRWASERPYVLPGLTAALFSAVSFILVLTRLEETVTRGKAGDAQRMVRLSLFSPRFWKSIHEQNRLSAHHLLPLLMLSALLIAMGHSSLYSAFPLYCKTKLGMSAHDVGLQFVWMGLVVILIQGGLIHALQRRFGEKKLFLTGNILMTAGLGLIPLASSAKILTFFLGLMAVGASLNGPTLNSLISKESDPAAVGAAMGSAQGLSSLGRVLGPSWGGFLFGIAYHLPFILSAALLVFTIFVSVWLEKWDHS